MISSSPPPAPLRLIESSQVSPPPGSVPDSSLPFTFLDICWVCTEPVEHVFFYQFPHLKPSDFLESVLPNLKSSLSLSLRHFYPLAGKIRRLTEYSDDRHGIRYVGGDSVAFTVAEWVDKDFDEHSGSHARDACSFKHLFSKLPTSTDGQPLLAIQITFYPNQGVAIGITLHHAACDGLGFMHFMFSWASCCRSRGSASLLAPSPIFDRTLVADPRGLFHIFFEDIASDPGYGKGSPGAPTTGSDKVLASFTLTGDKIRRLKDLAMAKAEMGEGHASMLSCSSISVAFAYAWVCFVKAKAYESRRNCHFFFSGDCRSGLRPPLPNEYFGNCLAVCFVEEVNAGDLIGEDGFILAARAICKSIELFRNDVLHGAEQWAQRLRSILPYQPLTVAGSPKMKVYDLDFGWGKPKKVEVASIASTGAMSVAESRDLGGLEIGIALPKHEMDIFATHFNGSI